MAEASRGGEAAGGVLLYGHLDTAPPPDGWRADHPAYTPQLRGEHLHGRGGCDNGYAAYAAVCAVKALQAQGLPHGRLVMLLETSAQSGSVREPQAHTSPHPRA